MTTCEICNRRPSNGYVGKIDDPEFTRCVCNFCYEHRLLMRPLGKFPATTRLEKICGLRHSLDDEERELVRQAYGDVPKGFFSFYHSTFNALIVRAESAEEANAKASQPYWEEDWEGKDKPVVYGNIVNIPDPDMKCFTHVIDEDTGWKIEVEYTP